MLNKKSIVIRWPCWRFTYLLWILSNLELKLTKAYHCEETVICGRYGRKVLFSGGEISSIHLANHASDVQSLHVGILEGYESAAMHYDT